MTCKPDRCSQESEVSILPSMLPSALTLLGCARPTSTADESSSGTGPASPSSPTSESLTGEPLPSTSFTGAIPASRSAPPESEEGPRIPATSGPSSRDSFAFYDRVSSCWRTSQGTLLSDSTLSRVIWPNWGMTCDGDAFELPTPGLPTVGSESSGLLPTPVVTDSFGARNRTSGRKPGSQHSDGVTLTDAIWLAQGRETDTRGQLLPTPRSHASRTSRRAATARHSRSAPSLEQAAELSQGLLPRELVSIEEAPESWALPEEGRPSRLLPTPVAADGANARNSTAGRKKVQPSVEAGTWSGKGLESLSDIAHRSGFTSPPSDDGSEFEETPLPRQLTIEDA